MSEIYNPSDDYRNWWALGSTVQFDGPDGERLEGEIVRVSSNPSYLHVFAQGQRYAIDVNQDNAQMVW